jgi:HPt (histidine-containing phosphotransfer) domain-containing protein
MKKKNSNAADSPDFKLYLDDIRHSWLKTLAILGFTLIPLFLVLDYFMLPGERFENFVIYRSVVTVLVIAQYLVLRVTKPSRYAPIQGYYFSIIVGVMISWMTHELGGFDSSYYAGLNLVMIAVVVLIPWGFVHALVNSLLIVGSYLSINLLFALPFQIDIAVNNIYFLSATAVIAVAINRVHFYLIRKEYYTNRQLKAAMEEQETIMNSVDEGLFIIHKVDSEYFIGEHQSESVKKIFGDVSMSGRKFADVMASYFSDKKIEELNEYLKMISVKNIDNTMIRDLNPLEREKAVFKSDETKFLEFRFKRVTESLINSDFLVSIKDVTKVVEMERQLRENEIKAEQESQMMLSILHVGPALLQDFMEGVEAELSVIETVLRDEKFHKDLGMAIETIFRSVHSLKGNAALLDLKFLAEKANAFENKITEMRDNQNLTWEDFLSVAYELSKIQEVYEDMRGLIQRIKLFQGKEGDTKTALSALPEAINNLALRIATETGKKVKFVTDHLDFSGVSNKYAYVLRDILVQLTRNSMIHGIENPETRLNSGKDECGTISFSLKQEKDQYCMKFRDDGKSFGFAEIQNKAIEMGKVPKSEIENWGESKLVKLIFEPGFSTTSESTLHSGRGMGMDIIKQRIKRIGGQIKVNYSAGKFTEFNFMFPMGALQK